MKTVSREKSGGDVLAGLGVTPAKAAELTVKSTLITSIRDTIKERKLSQRQAAELCGTDQPTLSKALRGRKSVTIDRLAAWLISLGRTVEIRVKPYDRKAKAGRFVIAN